MTIIKQLVSILLMRSRCGHSSKFSGELRVEVLVLKPYQVAELFSSGLSNAAAISNNCLSLGSLSTFARRSPNSLIPVQIDCGVF